MHLHFILIPRLVRHPKLRPLQSSNAAVITANCASFDLMTDGVSTSQVGLPAAAGTDGQRLSLRQDTTSERTNARHSIQFNSIEFSKATRSESQHENGCDLDIQQVAGIRGTSEP